MSRPRSPLADRFWPKVNKTDACWLWTGALFDTGYGAINEGGRGRPLLAHRVAYELVVGPIPEDLEIDHLCRVRHCVRPSHLEAVTHATNMSRSGPASKTHCVHGHEYTPENTGRNPGGKRVCRTCKRTRDRARRTA